MLPLTTLKATYGRLNSYNLLYSQRKLLHSLVGILESKIKHPCLVNLAVNVYFINKFSRMHNYKVNKKKQ